ncbi:MAG: tetratricopeptide repeat protein [Pirellulales bacterium]
MNTETKPKPSSSRWSSLILLVIVGTIAVIGIAVLLTPMTELDPKDLADANVGASTKEGPMASPPASIQIPTPASSELSTERIQAMLVEVAKKVVEAADSEPAGYHVAAMIYSELKQTKNAETAWVRCLELKPKEPGPYLGLATLWMEQGEDDKAIELFQKMPNANAAGASYWKNYAEALSRVGKVDEAVSIATEGLRNHPEDWSLWTQLGQAQMQQQKWGAAESSLRKATDLGELSPAAINGLATVLVRQGKDEEAKTLREKLTSQNAPANASGTFQETYSKALAETAIALLRNAAAVAENQKHPEWAREWLIEAIRLNPLDGNAYMDLSGVLRRDRWNDAGGTSELEIQLKNAQLHEPCQRRIEPWQKWTLRQSVLMKRIGTFSARSLPAR